MESEQKFQTKIELDVLFVFYTFSNQYGIVDTDSARNWAKNKLGIDLPDIPFKLTQAHINALMDANLVPDTRRMIAKACATKDRRRSPRISKSKNKDDK